MSKRKSGINVNGIMLLNKRLGVSSNQALQEVRRLFNANKAGHTGSLDPLATGLLPLCFGEATKVCAFMLDDDKRYQVEIQLGVITDSGDAEGQILETRLVPTISAPDLEAGLAKFIGEIEQVPPMYSALKYQGKKLYELARQGISVERQARRIRIFEIKQLNFSSPFLTLEVFCSKGTYIRSLAEDIGQHFGCGATVTALRRLQVGQFHIQNAFSLEQLRQMPNTELPSHLLPPDCALQTIPPVYLTDIDAERVKCGQAVKINSSLTGMVRIYASQYFLGLGELALNGTLAPKKLFNFEQAKHQASTPYRGSDVLT